MVAIWDTNCMYRLKKRRATVILFGQMRIMAAIADGTKGIEAQIWASSVALPTLTDREIICQN